MGKMIMNRQVAFHQEGGFILLSTMVVLLFLMIIGMSTYKQTVLSTKTLGMSRFKSVASAVTEDVLNRIERDILISAKEGDFKVCATPDECVAPRGSAINVVREQVLDAGIKVGGKYPANIKIGDTFDFKRFLRTNVSGETVEDNMVVYYEIQKLEETATSRLYRTTIISFVMDNMDVVESGFRAPIN